jgi:dynein heavy chain 1
MTLGNVYDMDLKRNESVIKEVIVQAQGEVLLLMLPSSCH